MLYSTLFERMLRGIYGEPPEASGEGEGAGLVLVADGVGGLNLLGTALRYVLPPSGAPHALRVVSWGHGFGRWHSDLTNVENHTTQASAIAAEVAAFRTRKPGAPVFLVGKSGGTGVVVKALEGLPEGSVEATVLIAPAISPGYDLTRALRAVRREVVVFWSPLDVFVLGLGTRIFGTIDRVKAVSAGLVGFRPPQALDEAGGAQYAKLRQVRWHPRMAPTGYLGGHVGPDSPAFLRKYVVPLLIGGEDLLNPDGCQAGTAPRR
jgi:pimeloyl-ACP methyl ester carboxylesterase